MNEHIKSEEGVYGDSWRTLHGGYFSDPAVAAPLVEKVHGLARESGVDTIIDLGGGVGSVLSLLRAAGIDAGVALVNLDDSDLQLRAARKDGVSCVHRSVDSFLRREVGPEEGHFLFMMRSVLHYFGNDGLRPTLRHLRAQTQAGEFFVHQSASFRRQQDADCLNELYRMMRTEKWYPTVDFLCACLRAEGWEVLEVLPGPPLPLTSGELARRYELGAADVARIGERLHRNGTMSADVFTSTDDGFCAFLHYWIYVCTPA
jgi:hypothetical protein